MKVFSTKCQEFAFSVCVCIYLHGEQTCQVDLRDGLGPLSLPQAASAVFGQLWLFTGFHQMPQPDPAFVCVLQHRSLCTASILLVLLIQHSRLGAAINYEHFRELEGFNLAFLNVNEKMIKMHYENDNIWRFTDNNAQDGGTHSYLLLFFFFFFSRVDVVCGRTQLLEPLVSLHGGL